MNGPPDLVTGTESAGDSPSAPLALLAPPLRSDEVGRLADDRPGDVGGPATGPLEGAPLERAGGSATPDLVEAGGLLESLARVQRRRRASRGPDAREDQDR